MEKFSKQSSPETAESSTEKNDSSRVEGGKTSLETSEVKAFEQFQNYETTQNDADILKHATRETQEADRLRELLEAETPRSKDGSAPGLERQELIEKFSQSAETQEVGTERTKEGLSREERAEFRLRISEAESQGDGAGAMAVRRERYEAECQVADKEAMPAERWEAVYHQLKENQEKGKKDEDDTLKTLGIDNNNYAQNRDGESREIVRYTGDSNGERVVRPDGVTEKCWVDVKSVNEGVVYNTEQLKLEKQGAAEDSEKDFAVVICNANRDKVRPSTPLAKDIEVYHRNTETEQWSTWDKRINQGIGGWRDCTGNYVAENLGGKQEKETAA